MPATLAAKTQQKAQAPSYAELVEYWEWCKHALTFDDWAAFESLAPITFGFEQNNTLFFASWVAPYSAATGIGATVRLDAETSARIRGTCGIRHASVRGTRGGLPTSAPLDEVYPNAAEFFGFVQQTAQILHEDFQRHAYHASCFNGVALGTKTTWVERERGFKVTVALLGQTALKC